MGKPRSVRIGPYVFKIVWTERSWNKYSAQAYRLVPKDYDHYLASVFLRLNVIAVRSAKIPSLRVQKETLLHEILHAINVINGWPYSFTFDCPEDEMEEKIVSITSPTLFSVLRENPELLEWLTSDD